MEGFFFRPPHGEELADSVLFKSSQHLMHEFHANPIVFHAFA